MRSLLEFRRDSFVLKLVVVCVRVCDQYKASVAVAPWDLTWFFLRKSHTHTHPCGTYPPRCEEATRAKRRSRTKTMDCTQAKKKKKERSTECIALLGMGKKKSKM